MQLIFNKLKNINSKMSDENSKRVVKKNNTKKMSIKVSTEDKEVPPSNDANKDKKDKSKDNKANSNIKSSPKKETNEPTLAELEENTKKMEKEFSDIKGQLKSEENKTLEEVGSLNKQLEQLNKNQINVCKDNKTLLNKLRKMDSDVSKKYDDKFKMSKILENKKARSYNRDINMKIKSNENEKINIQKDIKYNQDEINRLSGLLKMKEIGGDGGQLAEEYKELEKNISQIQKEVDELNLIKFIHKSCSKNENILKNQINVLNIDIEFEAKRKLMISYIQPKKEKSTISESIERLNYGKKLRNNLLHSTKNRYNAKKDLYVNTRSYNIIKKELYVNENVKKKRNNSLDKIHKDELDAEQIANNKLNEKPQLYLFTEAEKEILQNIVPNEYLNNLNEKFNQKEKEMKEIEETCKPQTDLKRELYLDNLKYEEINLKQNELRMKKTNLMTKHIKNNKKITEMKNKIKILKKDIDIEAKKLSGIVVKNKSIQEIIKKYIEAKKKENEETKEKEKENE